MAEPLIDRPKSLLYSSMSAISSRGSQASNSCWRRTMAKGKWTKAEREERQRGRERALENARRTRELAERAQAKLDAEKSRD